MAQAVAVGQKFSVDSSSLPGNERATPAMTDDILLPSICPLSSAKVSAAFDGSSGCPAPDGMPARPKTASPVRQVSGPGGRIPRLFCASIQ